MPSLVCISAANIRHNPRGTSFQVCQLVGRIATEINPRVHCETIPLVDYNLSPCTGCGSCFQPRRCCQKDDFKNRILELRIVRNDETVICRTRDNSGSIDHFITTALTCCDKTPPAGSRTYSLVAEGTNLIPESELNFLGIGIDEGTLTGAQIEN